MSSLKETPPPTSTVNVGFVGLSTGGWAANTLGPSLTQPALRSLYTLKAVSTSSEATAAISAAKWTLATGSQVKGYGSPQAMLDDTNQKDDENLNFVAVSVKAPEHKAILLPIIRNKKDFFVEWPAGKSADDTRELSEEAKKYGVRSLIGLQGRQGRVVNKVKFRPIRSPFVRLTDSHNFRLKI